MTLSAYVLFVDDSKQGVQQLLRNRLDDPPRDFQAYGSVACLAESVPALAWDLRNLCRATGFREYDEFKWVPPRGSWMKDSMSDSRRDEFLQNVCGLLAQHGATVLLSTSSVAEAAEVQRPSLRRFMEQTISSAVKADLSLSYVFDLPSDGLGRGLAPFLEHLIGLGSETVHSAPRVALEVCSYSRYSRLLQAADFVTSCALAYLIGNRRRSASYFPMLADLIGSPGSPWSEGGFWIGEDEVTRRVLSEELAQA